MATVLLLRHGLTAVTGSTLAGQAAGLDLDDRGYAQADAVGARLADVPLARVVSSPLERCEQTARAVLTAQHRAGRFPPFSTDRRIIECDYGDWTGQHLKTLMKDPLWPVVQAQPSAVTFPSGESMAAIYSRSSQAIRALDESVTSEHGADAVWLACSHGDVIKSVVADALGMHLDLFQRIVIDPCSVTAIRYTGSRPYVITLNDTTAGLARFVPAPKTAKRRPRRSTTGAAVKAASASKPSDDAVVGGGAGPGSV